MNEHFNWHRLGLLIRNDLVSNFRDYLILFAVFSIIFILNAVPFAAIGELREDFYYGMFGGLMILGGSICNSLIFTELYDKKKNENWLLLPASALEKILARYINGSVLYMLCILVFVTVASLLIEGFNLLSFGRANELFNPVSPSVPEVIAVFMLIQPVFFLGGVWFKSMRWFKTVISVFVIGAALGLLACIAFFLFFSGELQGIFLGTNTLFDNGLGGLNWKVNENLFAGVVIGLKILFYVIMPPFCCYLAWLRVKETQVSHGI